MTIAIILLVITNAITIATYVIDKRTRINKQKILSEMRHIAMLQDNSTSAEYWMMFIEYIENH